MLEEAPLDNSFRFRQVRNQSELLCESLSPEDCNLQAIPDTSPLKWHVAHTTWFFETFILVPFLSHYRLFDEQFQVLFNSYYNGIGKQHSRPKRHLLSRPSLDEVMSYRRHVDHAMVNLLDRPPEADQKEINARLVLGLNHEQQHQELMLTDLKYNFACNPLLPAYVDGGVAVNQNSFRRDSGFEFYKGGLIEVGQEDDHPFGFDNEQPRHKVWLEPFAIGRNLVTNGEFRQFMEDGGYERPELWLSDGWSTVQQEGWRHPLYWDLSSEEGRIFTLHGAKPIEDDVPVCHLSYFEADAFARWTGARLPTEEEWEHACMQANTQMADGRGRLHGQIDRTRLHPDNLPPRQKGLSDMFGQVWQWTSSPYRAYPGYRTAPGALGEYNGKFMCSQFVLRGSSCATPKGHSRSSYRNFFYPPDRWQFTGLRLARDAMPGTE
ncbi:ergothioneine biosynthesis protein EgtB [Marinobacter sp.]|uniref:ergothioneine biosynthesis protein EgtB n=1 Tax=Marinobacter sp. TaxID=50741 RepID=UPI003A8ED471